MDFLSSQSRVPPALPHPQTPTAVTCHSTFHLACRTLADSRRPFATRSNPWHHTLCVAIHDKHHGRLNIEDDEQGLRVQGDAAPNAGARRRRKDHHPLQAQARPRRHHHPHRRLQCRDGHLQEHQIQRLGRRRPGQDPSPVETLLLWNPGPYLRHRLERPRPRRRGTDRAHEDHPGQGNEGCAAVGVCQQAGSSRSYATKGGLGPPTTREDRKGPRMEGRA